MVGRSYKWLARDDVAGTFRRSHRKPRQITPAKGQVAGRQSSRAATAWLLATPNAASTSRATHPRSSPSKPGDSRRQKSTRGVRQRRSRRRHRSPRSERPRVLSARRMVVASSPSTTIGSRRPQQTWRRCEHVGRPPVGDHPRSGPCRGRGASPPLARSVSGSVATNPRSRLVPASREDRSLQAR